MYEPCFGNWLSVHPDSTAKEIVFQGSSLWAFAAQASRAFEEYLLTITRIKLGQDVQVIKLVLMLGINLIINFSHT